MAKSDKSKEELNLSQRLGALKNVPRLLKLIWDIQPSLVALSAIIRLVKAFSPLMSLTIGKWIIDEILRIVQHSSDHSISSHLWLLLGAELGIVVGNDILTRLLGYTESLLGDRFANDISVKLMKHAADLDMEHFEDPVFYDKLEIARQQTNNRVALMGQIFSQGQDFLSLCLLIGALMSFSPWFVVIALLTIIPAVMSESRFNTLQYKLTNYWAPGRRLMDYYRYIGASNDSAKEVKIFGLSSFLSTKFGEQAEQYFRDRRSLAGRRSLIGALFSMLGTIGYYAVYAMIIAAAVTTRISIGQMTFLSGSFLRVKSLIESLLFSFSSIADSALYLRDLFDFFEMQPRITSKPNALPVANPLRSGFVFENVSFRYNGSEKDVLHNLNLHFDAGRKYALVGENGAGKTTLIKLMARLYEPSEGRILLDGVDLRDYDVEDLRRNIGVIFQDFVRYQMSARDNIAVGMIDDRENLERITAAAHQSLANTVIDKLPNGYEQMIGRRFNDGAELSGGEWQKMALARAYMRSAQVIILDEPTAALDARAEHEVFRQFATLSRDAMAIFISHRFSTVCMADTIMVLEHGTVIEQGSHDELLAQSGRYAELFQLQAKGYR